MFNKKMAALVLATATSLGTLSAATAATPASAPNRISTVLSDLVLKGTITQPQADAITAALGAAAAKVKPGGMGKPPMGGAGHEGFGEYAAARQAIITSTLGITAADLKAARVAGKSIATIAPDKTEAVITALVNYDSMQIDSAVTAGQVTTAKAVTLKANLRTRDTAEVNRVGGARGATKGGKPPVAPGTPSN